MTSERLREQERNQTAGTPRFRLSESSRARARIAPGRHVGRAPARAKTAKSQIGKSLVVKSGTVATGDNELRFVAQVKSSGTCIAKLAHNIVRSRICCGYS